MAVRREPDVAAFSEFVAARSAALFRTALLVLGEAKPHRRLVYADSRAGDRSGPSEVHVGTQVIDVGVPISWLDATDDGAIVSTESGRIFFTDGSTVEEIGRLGFDTQRYLAGGLVRSGHTGSLAAWFDSSDERVPVLVVYDTGQRRVVAQHPVPRCQYYCSTQVVVGDRVYWNDQVIAYGQTELRGVRVFDLSTGAETRGSARTLEADVRGSGRGVVLVARRRPEQLC